VCKHSEQKAEDIILKIVMWYKNNVGNVQISIKIIISGKEIRKNNNEIVKFTIKAILQSDLAHKSGKLLIKSNFVTKLY